MFVFVDETGNTGKNLFDDSQPDFLTAALVTRANFDVLHTKRIRNISQTVGEHKLHANHLGFKGIEEISDPLLAILKRANARFFFSRVEKRYLLATKVVDHIFDSGENPTVPWHIYNIRQLRLMLVFRVGLILDDALAKIFWACLMERQETACREHLVQFCKVLLERVPQLPDARSKQLFFEALDWVINNPQALLIHTNTKHGLLGHMPNMVAFANLLEGLDDYSRLLGRPVRRITHDRQSQFEQTLQAWHELFANASSEPIHLPGEVRILQKLPGSSFDIKADDDSPGIQVIDVVLWLYLQFQKGRKLFAGSAALLNFALKRGRYSDFSFDGVGSLVEQRLVDMFQSNITAKQLADSKFMLESSERTRQKNMAAYKEDGLLPFQRTLAQQIGNSSDE